NGHETAVGFRALAMSLLCRGRRSPYSSCITSEHSPGRKLMSMNRTIVVLVLATAFCASVDQAAAEPPAKPAASLYTVDVYDPERKPEEDLKTAVARAKQEKKRLLVQIGGDWCGWCHRLTKYFADNEKVAAALA